MADRLTAISDDADPHGYITVSMNRHLLTSHQSSGTNGDTIPEDSLDLVGLGAGAEDDDGVADSIWMDLGQAIETVPETQADNSHLPVLMVVADDQDFYYEEYW